MNLSLPCHILELPSSLFWTSLRLVFPALQFPPSCSVIPLPSLGQAPVPPNVAEPLTVFAPLLFLTV